MKDPQPSSESWVRCFVALGSNVGDREQALRRALQQMDEAQDVTVQRVSRAYETEAVGMDPNAGDFLNAVAELSACRPPRALLEWLMAVEHTLGRNRPQHTKPSPRTIDLDLLFYGSQIVDESGLRVPHPRLTERRFVLEPLAELAASFVHPVTGRTVQQHLDTCADTTRVEPTELLLWEG